MLFPFNDISSIRPTSDRPTGPVRDTSDPHATSANGRRGDTGGKGRLVRQVSGQRISLDGELLQTVQVLDPQRKFARQPVIEYVQVLEVGQVP